MERWFVILIHLCILESEKFLGKMDVVAFHSHNLVRFSMCFSFSKKSYIGKASLHIKEFTLQPSPFVIRSNGDRGVQTSGRTEDKRPRSFDGKKSKSSDQKEIIALFRRIQISISKGGSLETRKRSSNKPSIESLLDIFDKPKKQVKGRAKGTSVSKKEEEAQDHSHSLVLDFKLSRPPSNFVKKSPIPCLSTPRGKVIELTNEALPTFKGGKQVEKLKLGELKALAKSRGVKGYSKLKKDELVQILMS